MRLSQIISKYLSGFFIFVEQYLFGIIFLLQKIRLSQINSKYLSGLLIFVELYLFGIIF